MNQAIESNEAERVALFIDGAYFSMMRRRMGLGRLCFKRFAQRLCDGRNLIAANFYDCQLLPDAPLDAQQRKQGFLRKLESCGYNVRLGRLTRNVAHDGLLCCRQKMVDTWLTAEAVELAARGDIKKAILVAGDGDFVPMVRTLQRFGVRVELWHCPGSVSRDLLQITYHRELTAPRLRSWGCELPDRGVTPTQIHEMQPEPAEVRTQPEPAEVRTHPASAEVRTHPACSDPQTAAIASASYIEVHNGETYNAKAGERIKVRAGGTAYVPAGAHAWALNGSTLFADAGASVRASKQAAVQRWVR